MYDREVQRQPGIPKIPQDYTDLGKADIALLTRVLSHAPRHSTPAPGAAYEQVVRGMIAELPSHLRCKLPWLCRFCSLHKNLNPLPVIRIFEAFKNEIEVSLAATWSPVRDQGLLSPEQATLMTAIEDLSALWLQPEAFAKKFLRAQKTTPSVAYQTNKCAACMLAHIGSRLEPLAALGGFFIGRVSTQLWKRSKRIKWIEQWVRRAVEEHEEGTAIEEVWQLGVELRALRKKAEDSDRAYIDAFVEKAQNGTPAVPLRPIESPRRNSRDECNENAFRNQSQSSKVDKWLAEVSNHDRDDGFEGSTSSSRMLAKPTLRSGTEATPAPPSLRPPEPLRNRHIPSSVYSRNITGTPRAGTKSQFNTNIRNPFASPCEMNDSLIDLYRHSTLPNEAADLFGEEHGPEPSQPSMAKRKDPELAKYPRHKLTPITIPRGKFGDGASHNTPKTGGLWKRRTDGLTPQLRTGHDGEVIGPFDPVSVENLFDEAGGNEQTWI